MEEDDFGKVIDTVLCPKCESMDDPDSNSKKQKKNEEKVISHNKDSGIIIYLIL